MYNKIFITTKGSYKQRLQTKEIRNRKTYKEVIDFTPTESLIILNKKHS